MASCGTCAFWSGGACHRYSPAAVIRVGKDISSTDVLTWYPTSSTDWCMDYSTGASTGICLACAAYVGGACHRSGPRITVGKIAGFTAVGSTEWCGEFST